MDPQQPTAVLHPLLGQTLDQYRIEGLLGQGGMGVVYRALDLKLQRPVALKILPPHLITDPDRRKRFVLEARAAARITHPAVAQVYDVDEHAGTTFIAMELVEGKTIRRLIEDRELDLQGSIDIAIQIAEGLAKAHELGIVHRDIKPANVIVTPEGHPRILDFGLAKLTDPADTTSVAAGTGLQISSITETQIGAVKGTAGYMSPEQVKAQKVDARSDLFSLGVVLYEMVTGELPFRRDTPLETMHAIAFEDTPSVHRLRPDLPAELGQVLGRCLQKRPEDRYPDARALVAHLRALRRDTESTPALPLRLRERWAELVDRVQHLRPAQYTWIAAGLIGVGLAIYLSVSGGTLGGFLFFFIAGMLIYRYLRNQPHRLRELLVRRLSKIPEVRAVAIAEHSVTVVVESIAGQLHQRIHQRLNDCNRKRFFGPPLTLVIRHDLTPEDLRQFLASPGVQFLRESTPPPL